MLDTWSSGQYATRDNDLHLEDMHNSLAVVNFNTLFVADISQWLSNILMSSRGTHNDGSAVPTQ
jgi:hypothetical protein